MPRHMKNNDRFDKNGNCNCIHITNGNCIQCSACDRCEHYKIDISKIEPVQNMGKIVRNGFYSGQFYTRFR